LVNQFIGVNRHCQRRIRRPSAGSRVIACDYLARLADDITALSDAVQHGFTAVAVGGG
jgi:hypothetical protein